MPYMEAGLFKYWLFTSFAHGHGERAVLNCGYSCDKKFRLIHEVTMNAKCHPHGSNLEVEVAWELQLLTGLVHSVIRSVSYIQSSAASAGIDALWLGVLQQQSLNLCCPV